MELPVIDHPEIPLGDYCYKITGTATDELGRIEIKSELCPYWKATEKGAKCSFLNEEHHYDCYFHLLWDQVKHCGINLDCVYDKQSIEDKSNLIVDTCECGKEVKYWIIK